MSSGLHVNYLLFFPILMKIEFSGKIFKLHENASSGSRNFPCEQTVWQA